MGLFFNKATNNMAGTVTIIASYISMFLISSFDDLPPTKREGKITPKPIEAIFDITPKVVTLGEIIGLNQVLANLDGELIIKIFPAAARKEPIKTGTRLELINTLIHAPAVSKTIPIES